MQDLRVIINLNDVRSFDNVVDLIQYILDTTKNVDDMLYESKCYGNVEVLGKEFVRNQEYFEMDFENR